MSDFLKGKRVKPEQIPHLVAFFARDYIPKIRTFLETDYPNHQEGVDGFSTLMKEIYPPVYQIQKQLPESLAEEMVLGLPAYISLYEWDKNPKKWKKAKKKALKAFLEGKDTPADEYGNPDFLSDMAVSIMVILNKTYMGLISQRGLYEYLKETEYTESQFKSIYDHFEDEIFAKGLLKTIQDLRGLIPLLDEIDTKLAQFPPNEELEQMS